MNDKNNDNSADLEEKLAKIANTKPRKHKRSNNIYERFINLVGSTDECSQTEGKSDQLTAWEKTQKSSSYEPLSAEELQLFASSEAEQEINVAASNTTTTDISFDFSNEEYVFNNNSPLEHNQQSSNTDSFNNYHSYNLNEDLNEDLKLELDSNHIEHTNEVIDLTSTDDTSANPAHGDDTILEDKGIENKGIENTVAPVIEAITKPQGKLASNKKPLIIGVALGTLLAAIIVLTLNASGILSALTETPATDASKNMASDVEDKINNDINSNAQSAAQAKTTLNKAAVVDAEQSTASNGNQTAAPQTNAAANKNSNTEEETEQSIDASADGSSGDPAITYEDFRKESQSTLYREAND